jgi:hypothetical protein
MTRLPGWSAFRTRWSAMTPRWRAIVALLMVFAAGAAGGALFEDIVDEIEWPEFEGRDHKGSRTVSEETILANMDLTSEQRAGIERLLEAREDRLESYWDAQLPELEGLVDSSRQEIRSLLSPEQQAIYDTHVSRLRADLRRDLREDDHD